MTLPQWAFALPVEQIEELQKLYRRVHALDAENARLRRALMLINWHDTQNSVKDFQWVKEIARQALKFEAQHPGSPTV